ncbi:MAG TPA: methionine--tRNA ligase [Thermomicrobiales bacterium]|nr:methionine--tRNA ligase [Thermomicrobiales bacterium]
MNETIGVFVAWPYANGDSHLGHVAGAYLPPDIFARYHRLRGNRVLMVSGSDSHGTPITIGAERAGVSPREFFEYYHRRIVESWRQLGISFDLFTHTDTENHFRVSQDIFRDLYEKGYITLHDVQQLYCEVDQRFLPDRYVEGACPFCGYTNARGDQCDNCGRTLDATDLIDPRCKLCGSTPVIRDTEHFFFDLPAFEKPLLDYINGQEHWRPNVQNFVRNWLQEGLLPRPVSRDIEWGIPVPIEGYEHKIIYVWFEAVIGYLSASIEWAANNGRPDAWRDWWFDPNARPYYFIGKDNIPFHAIIWPAELLAYNPEMDLPYDIPANEFLNLEGRQFSTSRNWAVWLPDYLERYAPDPLRYYLTAIAPETRDSEFTWAGYVERNNNELVAAWGNLVNRVVSFAHRHWDGVVPTPGELDERDRELLASIEAGFQTVGDLYAGVELREALRQAMALAREVNRYLDETAPWFEVKTDKAAAATSVYVALRAIDSLKLLLAPVLPFSSERVHQFLGYEDRLFGDLTITEYQEETRGHEALTYQPLPVEGTADRWRPSDLRPGQALQKPSVLFQKLDESVVEEERARLEASAAG